MGLIDSIKPSSSRARAISMTFLTVRGALVTLFFWRCARMAAGVGSAAVFDTG